MNDDLFQSKDNAYLSSNTEVLSLLNKFKTRELYNIPLEQGFCVPYGFIPQNSRKEDRNIAVTYRMNQHPDVMIVFQDASYQIKSHLIRTLHQ